MKVFHLLYNDYLGGVEKYMDSLIGGSYNNKDIEIIFGVSKKGKLTQKIESMGIKVFTLDMNGPFDIKAARKIAQISKNENVDIIHTHFLRENMLAVFSKVFHKIKVIRTWHYIWYFSFISKIIYRPFLKKTDSIICVSNMTKKSLEDQHIKANNLKVIYNGIDLSKYGNMTCDFSKMSFISKYSLDGTVPILSVVGRLSKEKGHEFLLKALMLLKKDEVSFKCIFAGDGENKQYLEKKVKDYELTGNIVFAGFVEDVSEIMKFSKIGINPSKTEAMGISVVEYLASGIPVVATKVGGVPEIIEDGINGYLVDYGNVNQLKTAIGKLLENSEIYNKMVLETKKNIKKFSIENMINSTINLYNEVIGGNNENSR